MKAIDENNNGITTRTVSLFLNGQQWSPSPSPTSLPHDETSDRTTTDTISTPRSTMARCVSKFVVKKHQTFLASDSYQCLLTRTRNNDDEPDDTASLRQQQQPLMLLEKSDLHLGALLGQGSFSNVYEVQSVQVRRSCCGGSSSQIPTRPCVVKSLAPAVLLEKPHVFVSCALGLAREGALLTALRHPNVIQLLGRSKSGVKAYATGRIDSTFLVLERVEILLSDMIGEWKRQGRAVSSRRAEVPLKVGLFRSNRCDYQRKRQHHNHDLCDRLKIATDLACGLAYLHRNRILHRDIKPTNTGFDAHGTLKILDFDVSHVLPSESHENEIFHLTQRVGTPRYMAPEVCLGKKYNLKADIYSFALVMHQIFSLEAPFKGLTKKEHIDLVMVRGKRLVVPKHWPSSVQSLLERAWSEDICERPDMDQVHRILDSELNTLTNRHRGSSSSRTDATLLVRSIPRLVTGTTTTTCRTIVERIKAQNTL